jgi:hypothetical protein
MSLLAAQAAASATQQNSKTVSIKLQKKLAILLFFFP